MLPIRIFKIFISALFMLLLAKPAIASEEPYQNRLAGRLKAGDTLLLRDEKFLNPAWKWELMQNHKVSNLVTFALNPDSLTKVSKPFTGKVDLKIEYWSQPGQADPFTEDHVTLEVKYDTVSGLAYKAQDVYRFLNGHKVKITINSVESPELGDDIPGVFMLTSAVVVDRSYATDPAAPPVAMFVNDEQAPAETGSAKKGMSVMSGEVVPMGAGDVNRIALNWTAVAGSQYDLEWTFIDETSDAGRMLATTTPTTTVLAGLFRNNATRVSLQTQGYTINLVHNTRYLLVRYRTFKYNATTGIREEATWQYSMTYTPAGSSTGTPITGVITLTNTWHNPSLNWQYTAGYAEEGKRKEVVSYFDKSLKNRQSVTLMKNSDLVAGTDGLEAIVQSTIYDQYGRPAVDVLPAPLAGKTDLDFYPQTNLKAANTPYSFLDVAPAGRVCNFPIPPMLTTAGASRYYSVNNDFKADRNHGSVPDANGYPFSLRYYMNDNTGRIASQGGVGQMFQPTKDPTEVTSKATRYFYSKPTRLEIYRLFGNDAGDASHYSKNTVIDPNGQVSVSYVNLSGKTVATALSGEAPVQLDGLPDKPAPVPTIVTLFKDADFTFDPGKLVLSATQTYIASETGIIKFNVEMEQLYSRITKGTMNICTACGFDIVLTVSSDCEDFAPAPILIAGAPPATACSGSLAALKQEVPLTFTRKGSYYIRMEARLKPDQIKKRADEYVTLASTQLRKQFDFVMDELRKVDFGGCFDDCKTCGVALGLKADFQARIKAKLTAMGVNVASNAAVIDGWSDTLYTNLKNTCDAAKNNCADDPCAQLKTMLKRDVSPYGQYALFDKNGVALEQDINVLHLYWREKFPMLPPTNATYKENIVQLPDGSMKSVNDSTFELKMLVASWRPEWADRFIDKHPEYCGLAYCEASANYLKWDEKVKAISSTTEITAVINASASYNRLDPKWLVTYDPWFQSGAPGFGSAAAFKLDLDGYSQRVKGITNYSQKGLNGYIDFLLYCGGRTGEATSNGNPDNTWEYCDPMPGCRIPDRELRMYLAAYMELKQKYYQTNRDSQTQYCKDKCKVGQTIGVGTGCPPPGAFSFTAGTVSGTTQTVTVRFEGGRAARAMTVDLYYPQEAAGLTQVATVSFAAGESTKTITIHKDISVASVKVKNVTCSGGSTTLPCNGVSFTLELGASGRRTGYRTWDKVENGKTVTYMAVAGAPGTQPAAGSFCANPASLVFYNCLEVKSTATSAPEYLQNVWLAQCPPVNCTAAGSFTATQKINEFKFSSGTTEVTIYPFTPQSNSIVGPCGNEYKQWYDCYSVTAQGVTYTFRNATVFTCGSNCSEIVITGGGYAHGQYINDFGTGKYIYTVSNFDPAGICSEPNAIYEYTYNFSNSCVNFVFEGDTEPPIQFSNVYVQVCVEYYSPFARTAAQGFAALAGCPDAYKTKQSRLLTFDQTAITDAQLQEIQKEGVGQMQQQLLSACEEQADLWISRLESCAGDVTNWATKKVTLRAKLVELCNKGVDIRHPKGASSTPPGTTITGGYKDFKEVIKAITAITSLTANCNPWLIDAPYPYTTPMPTAAPLISNTSTAICARITQLKQEHTSSSQSSLTFYQYLVANYGAAMTLTEPELTSVTSSCTACQYLLKNDVILPLFMSGDGLGYITGTELLAGYTALTNEALTGLTATHANYETIVTNYLNHRWGFTLGFADYNRMKKGLDAGTILTTARLVNTPLYGMGQTDPYDCLLSQVQNAAFNGIRAYDLYIEEEKRIYRAKYISECAASKAKLSVQQTPQEYHYTLYYYDQAGNLVRTVPPEGVSPLLDQEAAQAEEAAEADVTACAYTGPAAATDLNLTKTYLNNTFNAGTKTVEMWLFKEGMPHGQLLVTTGLDGYMLSACIGLDAMELDIYKLKPGDVGNTSVEIERSRHFKVKLSAEAIRPWLHLVLQGTNMGLDGGSLTVYANGILCPATTAGTTPGSCGWEIGYVNGVLTLPNNTAILKQLRGYNRLLTPLEILTQFKESCMGINNSLGVNPQEHWGRFNVPAAGSATTVGNTTTETKYKRIYPVHRLNTTYAHQSLGGVYRQQTPDAGTGNSWFDLLGRVVASQNALQATTARMSYTEYDNQGRVQEAGEKAAATGWTSIFQTENAVNGFIRANRPSRKHYVYNVYDEPLEGPIGQGAYVETVETNITQENLRKRVSASLMYESETASPVASVYSYDILGNVKTMLVKLPSFLFKRIDYDFDLASGKVRYVRYKHNASNKFIYGYNYDAENRLTEAFTGIQTSTADDWGIVGARRNAYYYYYKHGPLARAELGGDIQGLDYAYTLQGWLKAINGQKQGVDIGKDGQAGSNATFGTDVFNYSLDYFDGDYASVSKPAGGTDPMFPMAWTYNTAPGTGRSLYNGNIARVTYGRSNGGAINETVGYTYRYDQLNRLTQMLHHPDIGTNNFASHSKYAETITYDANGNIQRYIRNGNDAQNNYLMDDLTYRYPLDGNGNLTKNQLSYIDDAAPVNVAYTTDLKDQNTGNYTYDAIGNLTADVKEGISKIIWTVSGKIEEIQKPGVTIRYKYDPSGNRVYKEVAVTTTPASTTRTWYVRDAQGNVLALYSDNGTAEVTWEEQHLYGSSRLGYWRPGVNSSLNLTTAWNSAPGNTLYELNNHLGNMMAVVTGTKTAGKATVMKLQDYYPFGMGMPGRSWENTNLGKAYRYGFNGKENDNEVKGVEGSQQDYGFRIYDSRLAKFLSVDPLTHDYPWYTPYQFAGNTPVQAVDLDGLEEYMKHEELAMKQKAEMQIDNAVIIGRKMYEPHILLVDVYGVGHMGPMSHVVQKVGIINQDYSNSLGEAIASHPFASFGYLVWEDKGAFIGAGLGQFANSFASLPVKNSAVFPRFAKVNPSRFTPKTSLLLFGSFRIEKGEKFSQSEINAARYVHSLGNRDVYLRKPVGTRAGGETSDLVVNGVNYDVMTPITDKPGNIIKAMAKKNSQTTGIVLDLSRTTVTAKELGNVLRRVQGAIETNKDKTVNIKDIIIMPKNN
ncbi:RHS repeat-associated core domain-containing protein [Chitinophaga caseinilytica]|uniref:RHS repeat-associated core domain-containing protein n=1 Tax=Chitinophaga caseinilytica TaxID=2267521 RepID=UPI003C2B1FB6